MKRAIIIVLDSLGIGAMPDAAQYGDSGTNTFKHIKEVMEGRRTIPEPSKGGSVLLPAGAGCIEICGGATATTAGAQTVDSQSGAAQIGATTDPAADQTGSAPATPASCSAGSAPGRLEIPNLLALGFGRAAGIGDEEWDVTAGYTGSWARMSEASVGKDTITGHWEIAGLKTDVPFQTFTDTGFPQEFIKAFEERIGTEVLGNYNESGTVIIDRLGPEHEATGKPIVYTSVDSVFQIAANTAVIPLERLYEICETAREMLTGDMTIGRVIARPYIIDESGNRVRTGDRRDYALDPPEETLLDKVKAAGLTVSCVGKINDIFNGCGVTETVHTGDNTEGIDETIKALKRDFGGLLFTNLVDFDSKFGHRRDPIGYGRAIEEFDRRLPEILGAMGPDDVLFICADHGNDPVHTGWNHTREYVPLVVCGRSIAAGIDLGTLDSFGDLGATVCEYLSAKPVSCGQSFLKKVQK